MQLLGNLLLSAPRLCEATPSFGLSTSRSAFPCKSLILGQRQISVAEFLVRDLSPSLRIASAFSGIDNDIANVLIIWITA